MGAPKKSKTYDRGDTSKYASLSDAFQVPPGCLRRMVIVDGCNMLYAPGTTGHRMRDIKIVSDKMNAIAILITVYKLLKAGFEVYVTLKKYFDTVKNIDNANIKEELKRLEIIRVLEDGKDDDRVVLQTAQTYGAVVISNDNFSQTQYRPFKAEKERAIKFFYQVSAVPPKEMHLPDNVVDLFVDLKFAGLENLFIKPTDPTFETVQLQRQQFEASGYGKFALEEVTVLAQYMQYEYCSTYPGKCSLPTFEHYDTKRDCPNKFEDFKREYEANKKRRCRRN